MNDLTTKFVIAAITGVVGFFWIIAYKHPRTFKVVTAPFAFVALISLIGTFGFFVGIGSYQIELSSLRIKLLNGKYDRPTMDFVDHGAEAIADRMLNAAFYSAATCVGVLAFLIFFGWVGRVLENDRQQPQEVKGDQSKSAPKQERTNDGSDPTI